MSVPAIAFYASPPSSMCSTSHQSSNVSSQGSLDFDVNSGPSSSSASPSVIPKQAMGGLSRMFSSSQPIRHSPVSSNFTDGDGLASLLHERSDDLSCSYSYSAYPASIKSRDHSPVSVLHGPVSCGGTGTLRGFRQSSDLRSGRDRLFKRFVTNAPGSCLDYDSPRLPVVEGSRIGFDEFVFVMEDNSAEIDGTCMPYAQAILLDAQSRHKIFKEEFVIKAFYEAEKAHRGQMRASGDHYLQHCVETAVLLANIGANTTVVAAGLLHDTLDDSFMDHGYLSRTFGKGVVDLVKGVSKLSHLSKLARDNNTASKTAEADKLHTMFVAMADARAVLIKLADRLHNMMTLDALPMIKRQRFAKETLEIFAPLANRLGILSWKEQLENLCFKHLHPEQYDYLSSNLLKIFDEAMIASAKEELEQVPLKEGLTYQSYMGGTRACIASIHKKNLTMNEIHDIHGLRLIVDNDDDCYKALDVVHRLWLIIRRTMGGIPLEVQIRTKEMHLQAEFGFAAHWRYKEGGCKHALFVRQMVEWARWVLTWHCETMSRDRPLSFTDGDSICRPCSFPFHSDSCPFSYTPRGGHDGPVFVILLENEKMSVQELSVNSTLRDLYERISWGSSRWGACSYPTKEELRAKLNHEVVG